MTYTSAYEQVPSQLTGYADHEFDVTDIVQEIVNNGSWAANNDMRFGFINKETGTTGRGFFAYDYAVDLSSPETGGKLSVTPHHDARRIQQESYLPYVDVKAC